MQARCLEQPVRENRQSRFGFVETSLLGQYSRQPSKDAGGRLKKKGKDIFFLSSFSGSFCSPRSQPGWQNSACPRCLDLSFAVVVFFFFLLS